MAGQDFSARNVVLFANGGFTDGVFALFFSLGLPF